MKKTSVIMLIINLGILVVLITTITAAVLMSGRLMLAAAVLGLCLAIARIMLSKRMNFNRQTQTLPHTHFEFNEEGPEEWGNVPFQGGNGLGITMLFVVALAGGFIFSYILLSGLPDTINVADLFFRLGLAEIGVFFAGGLVGFIVGIPQSETEDRAYLKSMRGFTAHSNLEAISDWLGKIIAGVLLVCVFRLPDLVAKSTGWLQQYFLPSTPYDIGTPALLMLLFFALVGFLYGYFISRRSFRDLMDREDMGEMVPLT
jgi:hypothetical protein